MPEVYLAKERQMQRYLEMMIDCKDLEWCISDFRKLKLWNFNLDLNFSSMRNDELSNSRQQNMKALTDES